MGARQGRPGGVGCCVGCSRAATTRSTGRILCEASLDVAPRHPPRRRRDWQRLIFGRWVFGRWVFGRWVFGRWVFGRWVRGRVAPGGSGRRRGHFAKVPMDRMKAHTERIVAVYSLLVYWEYWRSYSQALGVLGVGCWALGVRQGRPGVQRLRGRWVALPPPVSRGPGRYPSSRRPRPRRRPPTSPPPPLKGRGEGAPSRRLPPKHPVVSQRPLYKKRPRSGRKFFERWVFDIGRWVFADLGVGCLPRILGVGWHGPPVGRWVLGVGCLWRRRWVVSKGPERRQRGGGPSTAARLDLGAGRVIQASKGRRGRYWSPGIRKCEADL